MMDLNRFFNAQAKTVSSAAGILAISALLSRFLGLIRDRLLAAKFGVGPELDIYFAAFRIPDFVYMVLIAGGLVVAFLPLFSEYFSRDKKESWQFTNNLLNVFLFFLIILCLILFVLAPSLVKLVAPGFNPQQKNLTILLTRLMFLSPIFFGLSSIFSGILQYFNRFLVYSLAPILYNLGIILGIIFLTPYFGVLGVALGVILGAFFHLTIQIPSAINCGFKYQPIFNLRDPGMKRVLKLMIPRTFSLAALQINLIVITAIASNLASGSIAIFNFANNLQQFPIGMIGVPFAIAIFPILSKAWAEGKREEFIEKFSFIFRQILFLTIPLSLLIFIFRNEIVKIILETGQFGALDTKLTAACLGLFSLSIFAQSLIPLFLRAFFSWQDTKTPTLITLLTVALNIFFAFSFSWLLTFPNLFSQFIQNFFNLAGMDDIAVVGLALASSISGLFQFVLLSILFYQRLSMFKEEH